MARLLSKTGYLIKIQAGVNCFTLSAKQWIAKTGKDASIQSHGCECMELNSSGGALGKLPSMALDSGFPAGMTYILALAEASC
jgi:hypothetical protein